MTPRPRARRDLPLRGLAILLALLSAALGTLPALALAGAAPAAARSEAPALSAAALEARHGLKVTRLAVTGGGGLVDLRFTVVDPAKARPLLEGASHDLMLVAERGGAALAAPHHGAMRNVRLAKDAACFVLFPNARGAVRPGGRVSVAFGAVRLEPVTAQ